MYDKRAIDPACVTREGQLGLLLPPPPREEEKKLATHILGLISRDRVLPFLGRRFVSKTQV